MTQAPDKLSIIVYSGAFDRVHYALAAAASAAAIDKPATLFFTMGALRALRARRPDGRPGWADLGLSEGAGTAEVHDRKLGERGVARFEELVQSCVALKVTFMVCEMGLRAEGLAREELRTDVAFQEGGLVTFLRDASGSGAMLLV
jgi:peroxiredoxin family protein